MPVSIVTNRHCKEWQGAWKAALQAQGVWLNFVVGDGRERPNAAVQRAFAVILYSVGKSSYGLIAKLFGVTPADVLKWMQQEAATFPEPDISGSIREMEFGEMWYFIGSKNKRWIIKVVGRVTGQTVPWLSAIVMLQPSEGSTTRSNT